MSAFSRLVGVQYPVLVAEDTTAGVESTASSVATITNMGGIGVIDAGAVDADMLDAIIDRVHALTDAPFGVYLPGPVARSGTQLFEIISRDYPQHVAFVAKLKYELCHALGQDPGDPKFDADRLIDVIRGRAVAVSVVGRECPDDLVRDLSRRSKTIAVAASVDKAHLLADHGVCGIIPSHRSMDMQKGRQTYLDALSHFRRTGPRVPLISAGIHCPSDVRHALKHGAKGVWTRRWPTKTERNDAMKVDAGALADSIRSAWVHSGLDPLPPRLQETMMTEIEASLLRFDNAPANTATGGDPSGRASLQPQDFFEILTKPAFGVSGRSAAAGDMAPGHNS